MRHAFTGLLIASATVLLVTMYAPAMPATAAPAAGERVLLFTKTAGFRHDSIPAGVAMFQQMATDNGWQLTHTEDSAVFTDANLSTFDVVIMFQTSGMVWTTAEQRTAVQTYMRGGDGIVAIHNATDMNIESEFPWWDRMLGMTMTQHSATVAGTAKVADQVHPSNWSPQLDGSLANTGSGKCLGAGGGSSADGTQLIIWSCHGGANQRWTIPTTLNS